MRSLVCSLIVLYSIVYIHTLFTVSIFFLEEGKKQQVELIVLYIQTGEKYGTRSSTRSEFDLYGVVVHFGDTLKHGHYISYVKKDEKWFKANDRKVLWFV